jgi:16S rRNA (cytosine967-C5)-methyltransferase
MKPGVSQRVVAARSLHRVTDEGAYSNVIVRTLPAGLDAAQRAAVHHSILATLRNLIRWDVAVEHATRRPVDEIDPMVRAVLRIMAQELLGDGHAAHGVVDSSVEAIRELGHGRAAGLVNAAGRVLAGSEVPVRPGDGGFDFGIPQWMFDRIVAARGVKQAKAFFAASNRPVDVGIRIRPGHRMPPGAQPVDGIPGAAYTSSAEVPDGVDRIDPASTAVAVAVGAGPGMAVVDLAAAPGGKTAALWDAMGGDGRLVAVDVHEGRVERMRTRLASMQVGADVVCADARDTGLASGEWDRVLLDAPCTGIGTLRRRPEIRHRLTPKDPAALGALQRELLAAGLRLVRPGGLLVYSVCTLFPEETIDVVDPLPARPPDGLPGVTWGRGRLLGPDTTGTDGMFVSVIDVPGSPG